MDQCRFEGLTRQLGKARDRRDTVRILAASAALSLPLIGGMVDSALAGQITKGCRNIGQRCGRDEDCCGESKCANHRCKCVPNGRSCLVVLDEVSGFSIPQKALCCSADCSRGKNKCK